MSLPINNTPVYTLTIPSTGKTIKYRPFLVKDEKSLLIAQQSEDPIVMIDTLKDIIKSCINNAVDVDTLAAFDLEYIFMQIRSVSVGEISEVLLKCDTCDDPKAVVKVSFNLKDIQVKKPENHTNKIGLFQGVGVVMKYPTISIVKQLENSSSDIDSIFNIISECIDYIYDEEQIYPAKEQSTKELNEFLNNLTSEQFGKIQQFFTSMPKLAQDVSYTCPVCGKLHEKTLEGLSNFF